MHSLFHVSYLGPHVEPAQLSPPTLLPLYDKLADGYEVEDILDSIFSRLGIEYPIKWVSYPILESMWEPAAHLVNAIYIHNYFLASWG